LGIAAAFHFARAQRGNLQSHKNLLSKSAAKEPIGARHACCTANIHDGSRLRRRNRHVLRNRARLCLGVYPPMSPWELVMGSIMAVGITAYLVYAMLRPEKF
jgi:K+-transporting ATPase KdpF subunit